MPASPRSGSRSAARRWALSAVASPSWSVCRPASIGARRRASQTMRLPTGTRCIGAPRLRKREARRQSEGTLGEHHKEHGRPRAVTCLRWIPPVCGAFVVAASRACPLRPYSELNGKEGVDALRGAGAGARAGRGRRWRIHWRIRGQIPANRTFLGGLENHYGLVRPVEGSNPSPPPQLELA